MTKAPEAPVVYDVDSDLPSLRGPKAAATFAKSLGITVSAEILYEAMRDGELPFHRIGNRHDLAPVDVVNYLRGRRSVRREVPEGDQ